MEDHNGPEQSRIDVKIKRDNLFKGGLEDLWDSLWQAIEITCNKITSHWSIPLTKKLNDGNSVIRVTAPPKEGIMAQPDRFLEIRLHREERKIVVRLHCDSTPSVYLIKPDPSAESLRFGDFGSVAISEKLIAERLLELNLNS